jgi:hypothetical protein
MNRCGCNPNLEPFEFKINNKQLNSFKYLLPELFPIVDNIEELKNKIICEYLKIIDNLECGIHLDLEFLLEEISLVEITENG